MTPSGIGLIPAGLGLIPAKFGCNNMQSKVYGLGCSQEQYSSVFKQLKYKPSVPICMDCGNTMIFHEDQQRMECSQRCSCQSQMLHYIPIEFAQELDQYDACIAANRKNRERQIFLTRGSASYNKIDCKHLREYFGIAARDPLAKSSTVEV